MGAVLFLVLKLTGVFDSEWDWLIFCGLLSVDSISLALFRLGGCLRTVCGGIPAREDLPTGEMRYSSDAETQVDS